MSSVPHPIAGTTESDDHGGQITFFDGRLYVAHFWSGGQTDLADVVVFTNTSGALQLERWIELEQPTSPTDRRPGRAEFQAINP